MLRHYLLKMFFCSKMIQFRKKKTHLFKALQLSLFDNSILCKEYETFYYSYFKEESFKKKCSVQKLMILQI